MIFSKFLHLASNPSETTDTTTDILNYGESFFYRAFLVSQNIQTDLGLPGANFFIALGMGQSGNVNSTNFDTAYGGSLLYFNNGPLTVTVPAMDVPTRYFSYIILDVNINTVHVISKRTTPGLAAGGTFTVSNNSAHSPDYLVPSELCVLIGRIYGNYYDLVDRGVANTLIDGVKVNLVPDLGPIGVVTTKSEDIPVEPRLFMDQVSKAITFEPSFDNTQLKLFIDQAHALGATNPYLYAQLQSTFTLAQSTIESWLTMPPIQWNLFSADDEIVADPDLSAAILQRRAKYVNIAAEAQYQYNARGLLGTRYNGDGDGYWMDITAIPPNDGFWSITPYQENGFIPTNVPERYNIGTSSSPVPLALFGNRVIVVFSATQPAGIPDTNWCVLPSGVVYFLSRVYYPTSATPFVFGDIMHMPVV